MLPLWWVICSWNVFEKWFLISEGKVEEFSVIPIKAEDIVDTNGAGDAFVGGI